ncbi:hypothetical protein [Streptomyces sp. NPDC015345]|uniref:hypothetical protein n=1 Tax=Streptomyces sp. NPDC015345 TaxID=3364953 RepID=UPI0036F694B4
MKRRGSVGQSLAVLGLGGSLATVSAAAEEPRTPQVEWDQCPDDVVAQAAPTELRCATSVDGSIFRLLTFGPLFKQTRYPELAQTWQATSLSVTCNDVAWPKDVTAYQQGVLGAGRCCARSSVTGRGWSASTTTGTACTSWATTPAR